MEFKIDKKIMNLKTTTLFCKNCGKIGHLFKKCTEPRTSNGILCYYLKKKDYLYSTNHIEEKDILKQIYLLMICRKHSITFIDFIRGKYNLYDVKYLIDLFSKMTNDEKIKIKTMKFANLWFYVWNKSPKNTRFIGEYYKSYEKFLRLKNDEIYVEKRLINLDYLISKSWKKYVEPEWGFPKGRRDYMESDLEVSRREFTEETSVDWKKIEIFDEYLEEDYKGSDLVHYRNKYFIANSPQKYSLKIDKLLPCQAQEVSKLSWVRLDYVYKKIRPYYSEKIKMVNELKEFIFNEIKKRTIKKEEEVI